MKTIQERLNHSVELRLGEAINEIEKNPQLNIAGILPVLEKVIFPDGKDPLENKSATKIIPPVYRALREYYDQEKKALDNYETCNNQVGVLQTLRKIQQQYL